MGFFRNRNLKNNAAALPAPEPVTNIYQGPNYAGVILAATAAVPLLATIGWLMLVYLLDQAGYYNPEAQAAKLLILLGVGLPLLAALAWVLHQSIVGAALQVVDRLAETRIRLAEIEAESLQHRALTARFPTPTASRLPDEERAFVSLLKMVMLSAYDHAAKNGEFTGQSRPWSRREALATAQRLGLDISEAQAGQVRGWLTERGVVRKNQLTDRYPTMASFEILLNREYLTPVVVGAALPQQATAEWSIIN
jgi:hypothetical protein